MGIQTEIIRFRCTKKFKEKIKKIAKLDNRNPSNYIKTLIIEDMKKRNFISEDEEMTNN